MLPFTVTSSLPDRTVLWRSGRVCWAVLRQQTDEGPQYVVLLEGVDGSVQSARFLRDSDAADYAIEMRDRVDLLAQD